MQSAFAPGTAVPDRFVADQRASLPNGEFSGLDNTRLTVLAHVGHTPPWEAGRD